MDAYRKCPIQALAMYTALGSEAVNCLDVIGSEAPDAVATIVPALIALVTNVSAEADVTHALTSLAVVAGQGPALRDAVVAGGAATLFVQALASPSQDLVEAAIYGLAALSRGQDARR